jgi:transposase-like protein DUF772
VPQTVVYVALRRILQLAALLFRSGDSKALEIVVLRHELAILRRQVRRPTFRPADQMVPRGDQPTTAARQMVGVSGHAGDAPALAPLDGLAPGRYFRLLLLGYFEGIDSERGIAWRAAASLAVRSFLRLGLEDKAPDHSTVSRTRRLIDIETHRAVFTWVQQRLVTGGLLKGRTIAIDATTLEANGAMRSIVRRDNGDSYQAFLTRLAETSGIKTPTREALARLDPKRKKKTSNKDWTNPHDPDAKITKMRDGRTHLAVPTRKSIWSPIGTLRCGI